MKTVQGDLLKMAKAGEFDYIFHGCNCFHLMGAGIAKSIAEQFPDAKEADETTERGDILKLGDYTAAQVTNDLGEPFWIVNLYTQFQPGVSFEYAALRSALDLFLGEAEFDFDNGPVRLGFPLIGAGIGGGDWNEIIKIIENCLGGFSYLDVTIVEFKP